MFLRWFYYVFIMFYYVSLFLIKSKLISTLNRKFYKYQPPKSKIIKNKKNRFNKHVTTRNSYKIRGFK